MRNNLVHGNRVYSEGECKEKAEKVLSSLKHMVKVFKAEYDYGGWSRMPVRRKSGLDWEDPRSDA